MIGVLAVGFIGLALLAAIVGLAIGAIPHRLAGLGTAAGSRRAAARRRGGDCSARRSGRSPRGCARPTWAQFPNLGPLGTVVPVLAAAIDPVTGFLTRLAVDDRHAAGDRADHATRGRERRAAGLITLGVDRVPVGGRAGERAHAAGWALAGALTAVALAAAYVTLLRFDITLVTVALGTMTAVAAIARGAQRPFPGALPGSLLAAILVALLAYGG